MGWHPHQTSGERQVSGEGGGRSLGGGAEHAQVVVRVNITNMTLTARLDVAEEGGNIIFVYISISNITIAISIQLQGESDIIKGALCLCGCHADWHLVTTYKMAV